ncbi:hypothetical protein M409DRAFT_60518 [Zasmidium cellare ATCC 36951]|uniref:Zinc finger PHD-type domain-containing protein n=1 Tax=Zasmidium cellare ATCC 36951 TaxID=1080233 RepID=A0A6A6BY79_ZASCE|nr:uncharacterized protein M409DRAFT_60518 [Zasmidium cellare ATCC 36951]KAF2159741.1 hypothetical protein M409DRAFT_60518 [Zasmidium cellare ATCC 36951]
MPTLSHISTRLTIGSLALSEIPDNSTPNPEPNTSSCYILISPNKPFLVAIHIPAHVVFLGDALLFKILKDGRFVTQSWRARGKDEDGGAKAMDVWIGAEELRFPHVVEDGNANPPGDVALWDGSEVVVQISHARITEPPGGDGFGNKTPGEVQPLGGVDHTLAFTFKYRPEAVLRAILLPPPPLPSPNPAPSSYDEHPADTAFKAHITNGKDKNPEIYCNCRLIRAAEPMVTCDNDRCEIKTFHFDCVGLDEAPKKGATWLCPTCRKLPAREVEIEGKTDEFGPFQEEWIGNEHWY